MDRYNSDFGCTPAQYHASIDKLWKALKAEGPQQEDCFTMAAKEIERLRSQVDSMKAAMREITEIKLGCDAEIAIAEIVSDFID